MTAFCLFCCLCATLLQHFGLYNGLIIKKVGWYRMTFANVSVNREQLTGLSQLLLTAFPGCIIHQSCDPVRTILHLSKQKIDAVFVDADTHPRLMHLLNRQKSKASVYLLCHHDTPPPEEASGIRSVITYPVTRQKIQAALQTIPQEIREVI